MQPQVASGCYAPGSADPRPYVGLVWGKSTDNVTGAGRMEFRMTPAAARRLAAKLRESAEYALRSNDVPF
jgi:hypothetical protein